MAKLENLTRTRKRKAAWSASGGRCYYCKETVFADMEHNFHPREATIDHKTPKSRGGFVKGNIVIACFECNNRKGNMTEEEFRTQRR